jgi:tRNA-splicing ligase RtcB
MPTSDIIIYCEELIDEKAKHQVYEISKHPIVNNSVRIMPDAHPGAGCVIGFTGYFKNGVIPNVVGVDLGCGVGVLKLNIKEEDLYKGNNPVDYWLDIDTKIRKSIPTGMTQQSRKPTLNKDEELIVTKCQHILESFGVKKQIRPELQLGTLGGGNHFIEIDKDEDGYLYIVVHSGSRNFGYKVGTYFQEQAKFLKDVVSGKVTEKKISKKSKVFDKEEIDIIKLKEFFMDKIDTKVSNDLTFLPSISDIKNEFCYSKYSAEYYIYCATVAQQYAELNRMRMMRTLVSILLEQKYTEVDISNYFESVHNYVEIQDAETILVRKGAIRSKKDELLVIPLSMKDGIIIGKGKSNKDWNESAPHGAGRLYGRSDMSKKLHSGEITMDNFKEDMKDVYSFSVTEDTIDESSFAYKPAQSIIDAISDTVDIIQTCKPVFNLKDIAKEKR